MKYLLLILFLFSSSSFAKSNAELLLEVLHFENDWNKVVAEVTEYAIVPETSNDVELLTITSEHNDKLRSIIDQTLNWHDYKQIMLKMINDVFTDEELSQIISFYQSEAGKKLLDEENLVYIKFKEEISSSIGQYQKLYNEESERYSQLLNELIKQRE